MRYSVRMYTTGTHNSDKVFMRRFWNVSVIVPTLAFNHWKVVFVPCDVGLWHALGKAGQSQSAAAVHLLIGQVLPQ